MVSNVNFCHRHHNLWCQRWIFAINTNRICLKLWRFGKQKVMWKTFKIRTVTVSQWRSNFDGLKSKDGQLSENYLTNTKTSTSLPEIPIMWHVTASFGHAMFWTYLCFKFFLESCAYSFVRLVLNIHFQFFKFVLKLLYMLCWTC